MSKGMQSSKRSLMNAASALGLALAAATPGTALAATATTPHSSAADTSAAHLARSKAITLVVKSDEEHGRKGPEGKWHDAFLPASFTVARGARVKVTVYNHDEGAHSFTSAKLGVNARIPGGTDTRPRVTHFTFIAPRKAGRYEWHCNMPCDSSAMSQVGFMRGYVTVR